MVKLFNTNIAAQKDMLGHVMDMQYQQTQRMNPLIQKMKNADLVRQQAMVNTMGQNYAMLGTLATAGKFSYWCSSRNWCNGPYCNYF